MKKIASLVCAAIFVASPWALIACPHTNPPVVPLDGDAAKFVPIDSTVGQLTTCQQACNAMVSAGCQPLADCPEVMQKIEDNRTIRNPSTNLPVTCLDVMASPATYCSKP
jgi:hypothetical protein